MKEEGSLTFHIMRELNEKLEDPIRDWNGFPARMKVFVSMINEDHWLDFCSTYESSGFERYYTFKSEKV